MSPELVIRQRVREHLREEAKTAAAILRYCPEFAAEEEIGPWLRRIGAGTVRASVVRGWLCEARVDAFRPVGEMSVWQRQKLSSLLVQFAKDER